MWEYLQICTFSEPPNPEEMKFVFALHLHILQINIKAAKGVQSVLKFLTLLIYRSQSPPLISREL